MLLCLMSSLHSSVEPVEPSTACDWVYVGLECPCAPVGGSSVFLLGRGSGVRGAPVTSCLPGRGSGMHLCQKSRFPLFAFSQLLCETSEGFSRQVMAAG